LIKQKRLDLLLKEIKDPYVQENFYKLKIFLENFEGGGAQGPAGNTGATGPQGAPGVGGTVTVIAGETLPALKFVYIGSDGKAYLGNSATFPETEVIGMTTQAGATNSILEIVPFGLVQDPSFTFGYSQMLFLTTNGAFSTTVPVTGHRVKLGQGLNNGQIFIDIDETIILA